MLEISLARQRMNVFLADDDIFFESDFIYSFNRRRYRGRFG
jgi:hypothetical protein